KAENVVYVRIIHQALSARVEVAHLIKVHSKRVCLVERLQYLVPFVKRRLAIGVLKIRKPVCICRHIEGGIAAREVAIALDISSRIQRYETGQELSRLAGNISLHCHNRSDVRSDSSTRTRWVPGDLIPSLQQ